MRLSWVKFCLAALFAATAAHAATDTPKVSAMTGNFTAGVGYSVTPGGPNGSQWFVDGVHLKNQFDVTEKTKVIIHNAFGINGTTNGPGQFNNESVYFSGATLSSTVPAGTNGTPTFSFSNLAAYVQHEATKGVTVSIGNMHSALGMEGMWDRVDMHSFYYSPVYNAINAAAWTYDLGLKLQLTDIIPGSFELQLVDGTTGGNTTFNRAGNSTPGVVARYWYEANLGVLTVTPILSTLLENFNGGPDDLGITAGAMVHAGAAWLNAEWFYAKFSKGPLPKVWEITVEPGVDLGFADVSVKYDFVNDTAKSLTDHWIGAALSKAYSEKYRIKATYQHQNISGTLGAHVNDFRLLWSAKF